MKRIEGVTMNVADNDDETGKVMGVAVVAQRLTRVTFIYTQR